jgi:hypothetical protein
MPAPPSSGAFSRQFPDVAHAVHAQAGRSEKFEHPPGRPETGDNNFPGV